MVLNAHQRRVPFRHRVASHPHLHPGQVLDAFGVVMVYMKSMRPCSGARSVECDERRFLDAGVVNTTSSYWPLATISVSYRFQLASHTATSNGSDMW